ncbi:contact-dependent growth inhibition system immunity protein [Pseudomonas sp. PA27(2017)]|uniref:contact-dependent growth inhibition system immunity protein n=1 Tax=Pseudomonas sp. PA27(2017) TaxID=1932112 RepID=UPI00143A6AF8
MCPILHYFLRNYFHQDWMIDSSSSEMVVKKFVSSESAEMITGLRNDIEVVLALESVSDSLVYDWGGNYSPKVDGLSTRAWLESVRVWLERE